MTQTQTAARPWTKAAELAVLDETIERFRAAPSYLGPWLCEVRGEVALDVASDFEPSALPSQALRAAAAVLAAALAEAATIVARARADAARIEEAARNHAEDTRRSVRQALQQALARVS